MPLYSIRINGDLMFLKLLPEQLVKVWDMVRYAIAETFMPRGSCTNEHLRYMLAALLSGKAQCWMGFTGTPADKKFIGFMITRIQVDQMLGDRVLIVDSIYAYQGVPEELMFRAWKVINEFAKKSGCSAVQSLTDNERIVMLAKRQKFSTRTYLIKEVE